MVRFEEYEQERLSKLGRVPASRGRTIMRKILFTGLLLAFVLTCPGQSYAKTVGC